MTPVDLLTARRLRSLFRQLPGGADAYLIDAASDPFAANWNVKYAFRVAFPGAIGNTTWMDGSDELSLLVSDSTIHVCEGLNPPSGCYELANPAAEDDLAWLLQSTYGLDVPYGWLLPKSRSRPSRAR